MAPTFNVDPTEIRRKYLGEMARIHPDLARGDENAARNAARLNQARESVEDPESRARVLLARLGGPGADADQSLPPGFLATMMQIREAIEEGGESERPRWRAWAAKERAGHIARVGAGLEGIVGRATPEQLGAIRQELNAWRYIERLIEQFNPGRVDASGRTPD